MFALHGRLVTSSIVFEGSRGGDGGGRDVWDVWEGLLCALTRYTVMRILRKQDRKVFSA